MKLVLAKQDFRNSDAWSEVCDTLGLPDNTTQVEISASATKVRTVEHPAWEEKEFWQNLVAEHIMGVDLVDAGQAQKQLHHFRAGLARNDVLRIQMRSSCSTSDQSEAGKSIPEPPGVWPIYEGKEPDAHTGNDCERWDF